MRQVIGIALGTALLCAGLVVSPAQAQEQPFEVEYTNDTPLIVIRFNQPHVVYERALYNVISQALAAKSSAVFDVVSISVKTRDPRSQQKSNQVATANTHHVLSTLHEMGLPESRINLSSASDTVNASEVRIFVH